MSLTRRSGPLNPYLSRHLSGHAAETSGPGWLELARQPEVLDLVDARTLSSDAVASAFGRQDVPDEILAVIGARHQLTHASARDRRGLREIAMARHAGTTVFGPRPEPDETGSTWSVQAAWLTREQPHTTLDRRAGELNALTSYSRPDGSMVLVTGSDDGVRVWNPDTGVQVRRLLGHTGHVLAVIAMAASDGRPSSRRPAGTRGSGSGSRRETRSRGCRSRATAAAFPSFTGLLRQTGGGSLHPTRLHGASWRTR